MHAPAASVGRNQVAPSPPATEVQLHEPLAPPQCQSATADTTSACDRSATSVQLVLPASQEHNEQEQAAILNYPRLQHLHQNQPPDFFRSFRTRFHVEGVWQRTMSALLVLLRNAFASVSAAWLLTYFCSLGTLSSKPVAQQSYHRFLTATLVWSHFFFCLVVFFAQACFLVRRRFLSQPDAPPTFFFCLQRLYRQTYYSYLSSLVLLLVSTLLIAQYTPVQLRKYKLEFYIGCFCSHDYTTHAVISTRRIIELETVGGEAVAARRTAAAAGRGSRTGSLGAVRRYVAVFVTYSPLATAVVLAGLFVHVVSHYHITTQTEMLAFTAGSVAVKLAVQGTIKVYVIRRNVRDIRTMCVAVGLPTVLIDTQLRVALQRVQSAQLTITGSVLLAVVEVAMRAGKVLLVLLEIRHEDHKTHPQTDSSAIEQPEQMPAQQLWPVVPPRIANHRRSSCATPDARFQRWRKKVLAFHTAEIYADMSAEYIAIGCSAALLYFYWSHPKYELRLINAAARASSAAAPAAPTTTDEHERPVNQLLMLGLQVGAEIGIDYVSSLLETSAGIDFHELRKYGPFVACVFISVAVVNILISAVIFLRV